MTKFIALLSAAALVLIDQLIKIRVLSNLALGGASIEVIPGLFRLTYVENRGAAFGILQGKTGFLSLVVSIVLIVGVVCILNEKISPKFMIWSVSLVIAGGAGNLFDRVLRGFVVDYLDFSALFGFPVFNFADCCVVVGTTLILVYILFLERSRSDEDQSNLTDKPKKEA